MTCLSILREVFGYNQFRAAQRDIVEHVAAGHDALVLMPTGGGKSLCYQIPAIARQRAGYGVTIVISPLIALMHDQVGALHEVGVSAAFLNSTLTLEQASQVEQQLFRNQLTLLYAAPERITTPRFLALLTALHERQLLSLFAIDEAHCVSQWGHDFRPEYLALAKLHELFPSIPRLALTATADDITRTDILERLQLQTARSFVSSFDRPNICYTIVEKNDSLQQLLRFIEQHHSGDAGVVYCQSRKKVEDTAHKLLSAGIHALPYHAGLAPQLRQLHQDRFLREEGIVMVATIAFGMGIDKPDVRFVAHLDMPKNIEGYYQETGRAGRDGQASNAWMCYGLQDVVNQRRMIDDGTANDSFKQIMRGKLEALLSLAEATDCRRYRLLQYFGETALQRCGNCDNCLHPPPLWDATDAARKLLSTIYRIQQSDQMSFGAGHVMDIVRGKNTDKVAQYNHQRLSTFGVGNNYSEIQLRAVLRQMIASGSLSVQSETFNTLHLTAASRPILKGESKVFLRSPSASPSGNRKRLTSTPLAVADKSPTPLEGVALTRYNALKAWRAEVAQAHNLPAYVIFHDATLVQIAQKMPQTQAELLEISGIGSKKLDAYANEVLRVVALCA